MPSRGAHLSWGLCRIVYSGGWTRSIIGMRSRAAGADSRGRFRGVRVDPGGPAQRWHTGPGRDEALASAFLHRGFGHGIRQVDYCTGWARIASKTFPPKRRCPDIYLRDCMNAALAGDACGIMVEWNGEDSLSEGCGTGACGRVSVFRKAWPTQAPVAFVFSYSGTRHVEPQSCWTFFGPTGRLPSRWLSDEHIPMLTFHAETLKRISPPTRKCNC